MKIAFIGQKELSVSGDRDEQVRKLAARLADEGWEVSLYESGLSPVRPTSSQEGIQSVRVPDVKKYVPFLNPIWLATGHALFQGSQVIHYYSGQQKRGLSFLVKLLAPHTRIVMTNADTATFFQGVEAAEEVDPASVRPFGLWPKRYLLAECLGGRGDNTHYLIKAFLSLEEQNKVPNNYKLVIMGEQKHASTYQDYLQMLTKGRKNILFLPDEKNRTALSSQATLYVSLAEENELAEGILAAMAYGTLPLVADVPAHQKLIEKQVAISVSPRNIRNVAEKLAYFINRPAETLALGEAAKKYVEANHSWNVLAERASEVYKNSMKTDSLKAYAGTHE